MQKLECDITTREQEYELEAETERYRDILRVDVLDNYNTLSAKTNALIDWAGSLDFEYFLKTDHDIFIRLDTIAKELQEQGPQKRYWSGLVWKNIPPISDPNDKNKELVYDLGRFPPYTAGALYILSSDLVHGLASDLPRRYYQNEDQSLGVWLLPFNVTPVNDIRIQQWDVCNSNMIAKHPLTPQRMNEMYSNVVQGRDMCQGFPTVRCPLCYECTEDQVDWRTSDLGCDPDGVYVKNLPQENTQSLPPPVDDVMAGVVGYLPFVSCKRRGLEDAPLKYNYVRNGHLELKFSFEWSVKGNVAWEQDGMFDYKGDPSAECVKLTTPPGIRTSLISQVTLAFIFVAKGS